MPFFVSDYERLWLYRMNVLGSSSAPLLTCWPFNCMIRRSRLIYFIIPTFLIGFKIIAYLFFHCKALYWPFLFKYDSVISSVIFSMLGSLRDASTNAVQALSGSRPIMIFAFKS